MAVTQQWRRTALALLNDRFVHRSLSTLPTASIKEAGPDPRRALNVVTSWPWLAAPPVKANGPPAWRSSQDKSRNAAAPPQAAADETRRQSLADWCQALFSLNEFIYID